MKLKHRKWNATVHICCSLTTRLYLTFQQRVQQKRATDDSKSKRWKTFHNAMSVTTLPCEISDTYVRYGRIFLKMTSLVVCWYKNCENQSQVGRVQCHTHQVTNNVVLLCYSVQQISNRNKLKQVATFCVYYCVPWQLYSDCLNHNQTPLTTQRHHMICLSV